MSVKIEVSDEVINADAITLCNPLAVKKAVVIPENPTNGDVIKTLFPYSEEISTLYSTGIVINGSINKITWFDKEWWNSPYKAESEDKE